jgi:tetratricopeptide (TPR) repeat protein
VTVGLALTNLGRLLDNLDRGDEAESVHRRALKILEKAQAQPDQIAASKINLGKALMRMHRLEDAEVYFDEAVRMLGEAKLVEHPFMAVAHHNLGVLFSKRGEFERAEFHAREDLRIKEVIGRGAGEIAEARSRLGEVLLGLGRVDEAKSELQRAYASAREQTETTPFKARVTFALARATMAELDEHERGLELANEALRMYEEHGTQDEISEVRRWIRAHRR